VGGGEISGAEGRERVGMHSWRQAFTAFMTRRRQRRRRRRCRLWRQHQHQRMTRPSPQKVSENCMRQISDPFDRWMGGGSETERTGMEWKWNETACDKIVCQFDF